jgi:carboxypeptidase C (cathepsin A)
MTSSSITATGPDEPYSDTTAYGNGPNDSITDTAENAAITHHSVTLDGRQIAYTATAGHLVTVDRSSSAPTAKMFYVAVTEDTPNPAARPVTFFYNGGPGASSVYVLLGSFAPMRLKTGMPSFTAPAPVTIEANPDSLLDKSDLVFINPVGTGYSAAIAANVNKDFWGVDQDADSLRQFIKRYLTCYHRWNSAKFLFGESYGTARSCVLAYLLHEDGIDLNGVTLLSSILDYSQAGTPVGLLPTLCADAWYHKKIRVTPPPHDLPSFMTAVVPFAQNDYTEALKAFPQNQDPRALTPLPDVDAVTVETLSNYTGIPRDLLISWEGLNVADTNNLGTLHFLTALLRADGMALGAYDGRVLGIDTGIAAAIDPLSGGNDPTMTAVNGAYTVGWNSYLQDQLKFTATSSFTDLNDQAFNNWDFRHIDPTGAQMGSEDIDKNPVLYTAGDLAAVMALNTDLKVLSANGYFDSVTPFSQTATDLQNMPLTDASVRKNLTIKCYPSGHMVYLDASSRTALKADLAVLYDSAVK